MFNKILNCRIVEKIALRIIRTCKEMGIKPVAIYSKADAESLHEDLLDEVVCIGPAQSSESLSQYPSASWLLWKSQILMPYIRGYGFLAENAVFAEICKNMNVSS